MILGVNGRWPGARGADERRFAEEICRRLWARLERAVLFLPADAPEPSPLPPTVLVERGRLRGELWERVELPRRARAAGCTVVLHPAGGASITGGPHVIVVHDAEPLLRPDALGWRAAARRRVATLPALRRAARVVTRSREAADALALVLGLDRSLVSVADQGAAPLDAPATAEAVEGVRRRFALRGPYLLAVERGGAEKSVAFLAEVLARWHERRARSERIAAPPTLVVVDAGGRRPFASPAISARRSTGELRLGSVDDETLRALYSGALALVSPFPGEGFARASLEAMACGTIVVIAPHLSAGEVLGDAAEVVPLDPDLWVTTLTRLARLGEDARHPRLQRGLEQAALHSWDAGADAVLRACSEASDAAHAASAKARAAPRVLATARARRPPPSAGTVPAQPYATRLGDLRVAVVHDWLTGMRGGEKVLEVLLELVPSADLFTLLHVPGSVSEAIEARRIRTSFVQMIPGAARRYRSLLPLFPRAIESFDLSGYDFVLSSSHCVAKGARARGVPHLCYCHTPVRYAWDQRAAYLAPGRSNPVVRALAPPLLDRIRAWDIASSARVDRFVANSENVRGRIWRYWGRESSVVHPPVAVERFHPRAQREDFYLVVSALVPYKRLEIAIEACDRLGRELVVVGSGPALGHLRSLGAGARFTGWLPDAEVADLMERCRALIMPGVEDFGIVPVEAQAAGAPVIALASGGALETVVAGEDAATATGVFFPEPTTDALVEAMRAFEARTFDPSVCRASAMRFTRDRFLRGMRREIETVLHGRPLGATETAALPEG